MLLAVVLLSLASPQEDPRTYQPADPGWAEWVDAAVARKDRAWARLAELCDGAGHRLAGSEGQVRAEQIVKAWLEADGHPTRMEPVTVPNWKRGEASLVLSAPYVQVLPVLALGGSVATPSKGIEAGVVVAHAGAPLGPHAQGKIVLFNQPMAEGVPTIDRYGDGVQDRASGASRAAAHGAVAVLVRSVTTRSLGTVHTGGTWYEPGKPHIPAASVSVETAEMLSRLVARGEVRVKLSMSPRYEADAQAYNVVGEVLGGELPSEIVLIGAHLDSWDLGQGAHDDGAGVVHVVEALRAIRARGAPRRTVRAVLFANEENGLRGGKAYFAAHGAEQHVAAIESDLGGGSPRGWGASGAPAQRTWINPILASSSMWIRDDGGGADISPLVEAGVLGVGLIPDDEHYFDFHHTWADTVDKVDATALAEGVGALAALTWSLANAPGTAPLPVGPGP